MEKPSTYDPKYFSSLYDIESRHFWFRARNNLISRLLRKVVKSFSSGYRVLEIGCGTGNVLNVISEVCERGSIVGLDIYFDGLRYARQRTASSLVQGDMFFLPFEQNFNLIGLFDVLEHLQDDLDVLKKLNQMLFPGGVLIISVPAFPSLWSYFDEVACHARRYLIDELERKIKDAGFQVNFMSYYMMPLFLPIWIRRRLVPTNKIRPDKLDDRVLSELKIVPLINEIMNYFLSFEMGWISRGNKLPIGTSIIAIAYKPEL